MFIFNCSIPTVLKLKPVTDDTRNEKKLSMERVYSLSCETEQAFM